MEFNKYNKRKRQTSTTSSEHKYYYRKQDSESPKILEIVNSIFKKSFTITGNDKYILPNPESMFVESPWQVEELQQIKTALNDTKSKLNNYCFADWHQHTFQRNKAKDVEWRIRRDFEPEFVTQAWCKFHEIVSKYPLVPKENIFMNNNNFVSLHLCEAPGAFITCLNHWLKTNLPTVQWDWLAMTFNPYYEGNSNSTMISDDRFIMYTLRNWFFGKDHTGNLMTLDNMDSLIYKAKSKGKINLVTADGSVNCISNPGEQESIVATLHFCEVVAALHILETNGNFLLKIFTIFEHQSICLIYFLSCVFKKIDFYKPITSKEGNSEVYMICLDFKGTEFVLPYLPVLRKEYGKSSSTVMFKQNAIPDSFIQQIISCAQVFKNFQCEVIESNIATYNKMDGQNSSFETKKIAKLVADKFITEFPIQKLHYDLQIVGNLKLKKIKNFNWIVAPPTESFNERQQMQILEPVYRLLSYKEQFKSLEVVSKVLTFKTSNVHVEICINLGKPFKNILSSRFCPTQISEIFNLFFQVVELEGNTRVGVPCQENITGYENSMKQLWNESHKVLHFEYSRHCHNNETLSHFHRTLLDLKNEENLILVGFHLLTQFHVGLIYLLAHAFERVEFSANDQIGCLVSFKCFKNRELILEKIEQITKFAESANANNLIILSIISMTELYGSELYPLVVKLNEWIINYCVHCISSVYENTKEKS